MKTIFVIYVILSLGCLTNCIVSFAEGNINAGLGWFSAFSFGIVISGSIFYMKDETE
jgi:hypothetical protein